MHRKLSELRKRNPITKTKAAVHTVRSASELFAKAGSGKAKAPTVPAQQSGDTQPLESKQSGYIARNPLFRSPSAPKDLPPASPSDTVPRENRSSLSRELENLRKDSAVLSERIERIQEQLEDLE